MQLELVFRLIIRRLQLFVPRLVFNSEGQKLYMEDYLKPYKWTYLKETVFTSNLSKQNSGHFRTTNGISKPRHVFVFFINNANINNQLQNSFLYNTFSVPTDPRTLTQCRILKLETEMNIQEFIINPQKMHREFFAMQCLMFMQAMITKEEHFLIFPISKNCALLFILTRQSRKWI